MKINILKVSLEGLNFKIRDNINEIVFKIELKII